MSDRLPKTTKSSSAPKFKAKFADPPNKDEADAKARLALTPTANAAVVTEAYSKSMGAQDLGALMDALEEGIEDVRHGDLAGVHAMLFAQANALQAIFTDLSRRAKTQTQLPQWEAILRMALKAQNQGRMTLETLATIKNPPAVYARQANINNGGQQQVNNGVTATDAPAPARNQFERTELLEADLGERMDPGATREAIDADSIVEAMGAIHRTANPAG